MNIFVKIVGFGEDIDWVKWDESVETALEQNKPIFLLIHKTWCHACRCKDYVNINS